MLISTKGRYALRVVLDLAENQKEDEFVVLKDIAQRQEISVKYLESIMHRLVKSSLVEGSRGKGGGYRLTRSPSSLTVSEVLTAAEGTLAPVMCLECKHNPCSRATECKTLPLWKLLQENINGFLEGITIAQLVAGSDKKELK